MATSTFSKQFVVEKGKTDEFVEEMTKPVAPTLEKSFESNLVHLANDKEIRDTLLQALN